MMHGHEKSDPVIVAVKPTNNTERSAAEPVEPRTGTKGNVRQRCPCRAQYRVSGPLVAGVHTAGLPWIPEVGAVCGKAARTDLCGGREVTRVPTATLRNAAIDGSAGDALGQKATSRRVQTISASHPT